MYIYVCTHTHIHTYSRHHFPAIQCKGMRLKLLLQLRDQILAFASVCGVFHACVNEKKKLETV